jgi:hypothetical protein
MASMDVPADRPVTAPAARARVGQPTYIAWLTLVFMTTASVASMRSTPTMAVYGLTCVFLYLVPAIMAAPRALVGLDRPAPRSAHPGPDAERLRRRRGDGPGRTRGGARTERATRARDVLPAFWLLVPGAIGLIGITEIVGDSAEAGFENFLRALVSVPSIALGILVGTMVVRALGATARRSR